MSDPADVVAPVLELVRQPDWAACAELVEARPAVRTAAADALLDLVISAARQGNAPDVARLAAQLGNLRRALRRTRETTVAAAFAEAAQAGPYLGAALLPPDYTAQTLLMVLIAAVTPAHARRLLEATPELLDPEIDAAADRLVTLLQADPAAEGGVRMVREHQHLLARCREVGIERAFDERTPMSGSAADTATDAVPEFVLAPSTPQALDVLDTHPVVVDAPAGASDPETDAVRFDLLGGMLRSRYESSGDPDDLRGAVDAHRQAVRHCPHGSTWRAGLLTNLGAALADLASLLDDAGLLDEAVDAYREATALPDAGPADPAGLLANLADALGTRFSRTGDPADLDDLIATLDRGVALTTGGDRWWLDLRYNLGLALGRRCGIGGGVPDLDRAITIFDATLAALPDPHPQRSSHLAARGNAWHQHHRHDRHDRDRISIDRAITDHRAALEAARDTPALGDRPGLLSALADALDERWAHIGDPADLHAAIEHLTDAARAAPPGHDRRAECLGALSAGLLVRYHHLGDPADLDDAVAAGLDALLGSTPEHRAGHLLTWADALLARSARSSRIDDLDAACTALAEAVDGAGGAAARGRLADALRARYGITRDDSDLATAIRLHEEALAGRLDPPERATHHRTGLANALSERYDAGGDVEDLDRAIDLRRRVLDSLPGTSVDNARMSGNLAGDLLRRTDHVPDAGTLAEALDLARAAVARTPQSSPDMPSHLSTLAGALHRSGHDTAATERYREACELAGGISARATVGPAAAWGHWATGRKAWADAAHAYELGLRALRDMVGAQASRRDKQIWLHGARQFSTGLATARIAAGDLPGAALAVDRGRALMLAEALRGPTTSGAPELADRPPVPAEPTSADLAQLARVTPLVYVLAAEDGGSAVVVRGDRVDHVPLPGLSAPALRRRAAAYLTTRSGSAGWRHPRDLHPGAPAAPSDVAAWLWPTFAAPLIEALGTDTEIVLLADGLLAALPLQAAWTPDPHTPTGRRYALDHLTITHAPNATALRAARAAASRASLRHLVSIVDPTLDLPAAPAEATAVAAALSTLAVVRLDGVAATRASFDRHAPDADVLHFAGHAEADLLEPLRSALHLADGPVTLGALMTGSLRCRLAVLSACVTGQPGTELPEEVVALPAALLQTGAAGVIASQWPVPDAPTAMVVSECIRLWAGGDLSPAAALRQAQRWLRDTTDQQKVDHYDGIGLPDAAAEVFGRALSPASSTRGFTDPIGWAAFIHVGA